MSEKQLECTRAAGEHQKTWFAQLRKDVFEKQRPYAIVQADMPFELFHVMDVPVVSNQWWASIISAKRLSGYYLDILNSLGFHDGLCRYCSLAAASTLAKDPERAPWGGLPKPALLSGGSRATASSVFSPCGEMHLAPSACFSTIRGRQN